MHVGDVDQDFLVGFVAAAFHCGAHEKLIGVVAILVTRTFEIGSLSEGQPSVAGVDFEQSGIGAATDRPRRWLGLLAAELIDKRLILKDDCFSGVWPNFEDIPKFNPSPPMDPPPTKIPSSIPSISVMPSTMPSDAGGPTMPPVPTTTPSQIPTRIPSLAPTIAPTTAAPTTGMQRPQHQQR